MADDLLGKIKKKTERKIKLIKAKTCVEGRKIHIGFHLSVKIYFVAF